jgi:hypothetical protein
MIDRLEHIKYNTSFGGSRAMRSRAALQRRQDTDEVKIPLTQTDPIFVDFAKDLQGFGGFLKNGGCPRRPAGLTDDHHGHLALQRRQDADEVKLTIPQRGYAALHRRQDADEMKIAFAQTEEIFRAVSKDLQRLAGFERSEPSALSASPSRRASAHTPTSANTLRAMLMAVAAVGQPE